MNIENRLVAIERKQEEKNRHPVIIAEETPDGRYMWQEETYTREELDRLQKKNRAALIIDDVIVSARGELKPPETIKQ
ncbi:MAG: hypothetical protein J1E64_04875 [Acetatifactor sp.]|nr:hypothetical protein [Acetatifactor sp.]